jgi:hypothetical protein
MGGQGEPRRAITVRTVEIDGRTIPADTHVWLLDGDGAFLEIEHKGRGGRVPADSVAACPVKAPSLEDLKKLDPCFGCSGEAFAVEHADPSSYFQILCCRAHGKRFLRHLRGGFAMYERQTLLRDTDDGDAQQIWARYQGVSDDWLNWEGRSL